LASVEANELVSNLGMGIIRYGLVSRLEKPHKLSHQHIYADFYELEVKDGAFVDDSYVKMKFGEVEKYPVPVLISNFLEDYVF